MIISSRTMEPWLGDVRRIQLGGLTPPEVAEMVEDLLGPCPRAEQSRQDRGFADLLAWLDGHPPSLRLLLPHLEHSSPSAPRGHLQGKTGQLPPGFVGVGRMSCPTLPDGRCRKTALSPLCGTRLGPAFEGRARSPKDRQPIVDERFGSPRRRQAVLTRRALPDFAEPYLSRIRIAGNKAASSRSLTSAAG